MDHQDSPPDIPRAVLLVIAFVQGVCLFALYRSIEAETWPSQSPMWSYPLWTLAVFVPLVVLLALDRLNYREVLKLTSGFAAFLLACALYTGWQAEPFADVPAGSLTAVYAFCMALATFKVLMYLQQRAAGVKLTYQVLFTNSWRNFLIGGLSGVFAAVFFAILMLWASLFSVLGIEFFRELFTEDWFIVPVLSTAFGLGVTLFRRLTHVIDNITRLLHWLIKLLLPVVLFVAVVFLATLPFVGLDALWSTGRGTALLLVLMAVVLFFVNAVYQDGREENPYPVLVHRAIYLSVCVLPVVSALSLYGLSLRLMQYGWTVERAWAMVVWVVLSAFAIGYVFGVLRRRDDWTDDLARVNTVMGLVVLAIMLLTNSPVLDFRKISLSSQLARVESGEIELREFDFHYAKWHLGRPGYLAMEEMKAEIRDSDPDLLAMIENPVSLVAGLPLPQDLWKNITYRPEELELDTALRRKIERRFGLRHSQKALLIETDADEDGEAEYLMLGFFDDHLGMSVLFYQTDEGWRSSDAHPLTGGMYEDILEGEISLVNPRFKQLEVGGVTFRLSP